MLKRNRHLLILTIALVAALIGSAHFQYFETRQLQINNFADKQFILARQGAASVREYINVQIAALRVLAENNSNRPVDRNYRQFIRNYVKGFQFIALVDTNCECFNSFPQGPAVEKIPNIDIETDLKPVLEKMQSNDQDYRVFWFGKNVTSKKVGLLLRLPDQQSGKEMMLLGTIDLISTVNRNLEPVLAQANSHIAIFDVDGTLLFHQAHPEMVSNNIYRADQTCYNCHADFAFEKSMLKKSGGWGIQSESRGPERLIAYTQINLPGLNWVLTIDTPSREITKISRGQFWNFVLITALMIAVVVAGSRSIFKNNLRKHEIEEERERLAAESKLNETIRIAEEKYRLLVEQSPNAIALFQKDTCLLANQRYLQLFNITIDRLNDTSFDQQELIDENEREQFNAKMQAFVASSHALESFSLKGISTDGSKLDLELSVSKITLNGEIAYQLVFNDVSKLRKVERELNRKKNLALMGEMSARIAHEIKNPLASLQAGIQLLESNICEDKELHDYFSRLTGEVVRVDNIVKGLLNFAREENLSKNESDINALIHNVVSLIRPAVNGKEIHWELPPPDKPCVLPIDAPKIEQVIWNLLNNSIHAISKQGEIKISLACNSNRVEISIRDNGSGIPKDQFKNLFSPFFSTKTQGTGLGLAISKKIISAHEGKIQVESEPGQGTCVKIKLPGNRV